MKCSKLPLLRTSENPSNKVNYTSTHCCHVVHLGFPCDLIHGIGIKALDLICRHIEKQFFIERSDSSILIEVIIYYATWY